MALKTLLTLLAAVQVQVARCDTSHPVHYKTVDEQFARGLAAAKGRTLAGKGELFADQGFWFSHFTVGGSPDLEILIDTGSSDTIMNPGVYRPSPSSVNTGRGFRISYSTTNPDGSGSLTAAGDVYEDVVTQLGANLTVPDQAIGDIKSPTSPPTFPHDGLIGYAGADQTALKASPFFHSLCDQGTLSACRFGLALRADQTGTLYYGSLASDQFKGSLSTEQIQGEWAIEGEVTVRGKKVTSRVQVVTDSGTTVIFGPVAQVQKVFKAAGIQAVRDENGVTGYYACDAPPQIGFTFGGTNFNILESALAFKKNGNNCTASIHGSSDFGNIWLVGQAFFQGRYIDHNVDDGTMGFANLK